MLKLNYTIENTIEELQKIYIENEGNKRILSQKINDLLNEVGRDELILAADELRDTNYHWFRKQEGSKSPIQNDFAIGDALVHELYKEDFKNMCFCAFELVNEDKLHPGFESSDTFQSYIGNLEANRNLMDLQILFHQISECFETLICDGNIRQSPYDLDIQVFLGREMEDKELRVFEMVMLATEYDLYESGYGNKEILEENMDAFYSKYGFRFEEMLISMSATLEDNEIKEDEIGQETVQEVAKEIEQKEEAAVNFEEDVAALRESLKYPLDAYLDLDAVSQKITDKYLAQEGGRDNLIHLIHALENDFSTPGKQALENAIIADALRQRLFGPDLDTVIDWTVHENDKRFFGEIFDTITKGRSLDDIEGTMDMLMNGIDREELLEKYSAFQTDKIEALLYYCECEMSDYMEKLAAERDNPQMEDRARELRVEILSRWNDSLENREVTSETYTLEDLGLDKKEQEAEKEYEQLTIPGWEQ